MSENEIKLIFVYGSLMRGERAAETLRSADCLGAGRINGFALYDLGDYPGIYPADERFGVEGEIFRMNDPASMLALLDDYEDTPELYRRQRVNVAWREGTAVAWIYVLTEDPRGRHPRIPGGHWPNYRRGRRGRARAF